jgi:hypothetical protein
MTVWQSVLLFFPLAVCTVYSFRNSIQGLRTACVLAWTAIYLICTTTGPHHLTWNYFMYPAALAAIPSGWLAATCAETLVRWRQRPLAWVAAAALACSMLPGSHIQVLRAYVMHWNDVNYNAPRFAQMVLREVPPDAVCVVDKELLLDFFVAGRRVLSAQADPFYFSVERYPYDYFVCGRYAQRDLLVEKMCGKATKIYGETVDPFGVFAIIYEPASGECSKTTIEAPIRPIPDDREQ